MLAATAGVGDREECRQGRKEPPGRDEPPGSDGAQPPACLHPPPGWRGHWDGGGAVGWEGEGAAARWRRRCRSMDPRDVPTREVGKAIGGGGVKGARGLNSLIKIFTRFT
jgi:hypothetical protein